MYTLIRSIGKPLGTINRWLEIEVGDTPIKDIYQTYSKVFAILKNSFKTNEVVLDLTKVRNEIGNEVSTLNEYLVKIGNKSLPTTDTIPKLDDKYVRYADVFKSGYKVRIANEKKSFDAKIPRGDKKSLYLTKDNLNFEDFRDYCMVVCNGYFHFVDADRDGAWVLNAMYSNLVSKDNYIGILNFREVGKIKHIPIKSDMVFKLSEEQSLSHQMGIDIKEDITDKTVILVLGGYMHILDPRVFYQYNDTSIIINTYNLPIIARFHESLEYLDLSSLPYHESERNESLVALVDYLSDENMLAYATLSQSFIVLLDNAEVYTEKHYIRTPPTPNLLIDFNNEPEYPLFHRVGKCANYWSREEHGQYALYVDDNQWSRRFYETIPFTQIPTVVDSEMTQHPVELSRGHYLKIGTDIKLT